MVALHVLLELRADGGREIADFVIRWCLLEMGL